MAAISQRHVVDVVMKECQAVAELRGRAGYAKELLDITIEIITLENAQQVRQGPIQKQVNDRVDALGVLIQNNGWANSQANE